MVNVLTLFGETDLQPYLEKVFAQNELRFVCENAVNTVKLFSLFEEHADETDAVVVAGNAVDLEFFPELIRELQAVHAQIRIILILNGSRKQYLRSQLAEFTDKNVDIMFDDNGFDVQVLISFLKKGKLQAHHRQPVGFSEERETVEMMPRRERIRESFYQADGHYTIAVMDAAHGAGATTAVLKLAKYFALHNFRTAVIDFSGTNALSLTKVEDVYITCDPEELESLKKGCNMVICDFGTPYNITPKGDNFLIERGYHVHNLPKINQSDIKIIMGFGDEWNVNKIRFFFENGQWQEILDPSYVFLVSGQANKLKQEYPDVNILDRDEEYTERILEVIRKEEDV